MPSRCATTAETFGIDASVLQVATMTRSMSPGDRPLPASALAPASKAMSVTVSSGPANRRLALADRVPVFHQPLDDLRGSKGPGCGDRVLRTARYHHAELLLVRPRPERP